MGAHLVDHNGQARLCRLPGGFGAGHAAADDMKWFCHGRDLGVLGRKGKGGFQRRGGGSAPCTPGVFPPR
ncbi:hypothetical protein GCM10008024_34020 [Allgaiera indica]|uniref:Uncharacterized protein n=1 Tax=Allgaiera indica TaxID=765699 RepID=A0AAN5A0Q4_9RHOB|nr:hypothetical protein GCM10008024_34020 [Allgaiera indica]